MLCSRMRSSLSVCACASPCSCTYVCATCSLVVRCSVSSLCQNKPVGAPVCPLCSPRPLRLSSTDGSNYLPRCHRPTSSSSPRLVWHFAAFYLLFLNIYRYIFLFSWSPLILLQASVAWENVVSGCERLLLEAGLWGRKEELYICLFTVTARHPFAVVWLTQAGE